MLALVLWALLGPGAPGYDASYAILWGDALRSLDLPDHGQALSPTPHPLANLLGLIASLFGRAAGDVMMGFSYVSFAALGVAAFFAGRRSFGTVAGVAFAAILLTRPYLWAEALQASIDVPFLALVLAALAVALGEEERPVPVLALLAVAGLLRPEAWLLSAAYAVAVRGGARAWALAAAAPVVWLLSDLLLTGDPFFSLSGTRDLAAELDRERGLGTALDVMPSALEVLLRPGVVWTGLAVGVVALFVAQERARVPMAVLGLGLAGFLVLGVFDLPLLVRYLLVPGAMVALFCGAGVGAFAWLPAPREAGLVASAAVAIVLLTGAPATVDAIDVHRDQVAIDREQEQALLALADRSPGGCLPVVVATDRAVPALAYRLGVRPSDLLPARDGDPRAPTRGVAFVAEAGVRSRDIDFDPEREPAIGQRLPGGYERIGAEGRWTLGARC